MKCPNCPEQMESNGESMVCQHCGYTEPLRKQPPKHHRTVERPYTGLCIDCKADLTEEMEELDDQANLLGEESMTEAQQYFYRYVDKPIRCPDCHSAWEDYTHGTHLGIDPCG